MLFLPLYFCLLFLLFYFYHCIFVSFLFYSIYTILFHLIFVYSISTFQFYYCHFFLFYLRFFSYFISIFQLYFASFSFLRLSARANNTLSYIPYCIICSLTYICCKHLSISYIHLLCSFVRLSFLPFVSALR